MWENKCVFSHTKITIFQSNIKSVLVYGSETIKNSIKSKLQTFGFQALYDSWGSHSIKHLLFKVQPIRINLPLFSTVVTSNICMFLSCRPFVVITCSTPTLPVENVVITTKLIQDRNIHVLNGTTAENKGKTIH